MSIRSNLTGPNEIISATRTKQGLRIQAILNPSLYETGVNITDQQMKQLNLKPHGQNPFAA